MRSIHRVTGLVALIAITMIWPSPAESALPAGFEDTAIVNVASPTAIAFTTDGRLLITAQNGKLWVYANGALVPTPALDLASSMCADSERGLLGLAVDPAFSSNGYIYLYYTFNKFNSCVHNAPTSPVNRVARFTLTTGNTVSRSSELVLIDNIPSPNGNHNGGDVQVGPDGFLYVSIGDGGCDYRGDSGCAGANDAARDQHVLLGKILRITRTGGIPAGNPFQGSGSVRCNMIGIANPGQTCQETFASGLRNPFRMAFDPNSSRFFINDVGQNTWEEVDAGTPGADYGWNLREGHCANGSTTDCGAPPAGVTNPIYDYDHSAGCASITGGAFVPSGVWPAAYEGSYLFADYVCGSIFRLVRQSNGTYAASTFATGLGNSSAVAMIFGPYGSTQALYYTTYAGGGQVRRIAANGNRAPTATASASPRSGPTPLNVRFDASASSDPDGDTLTFEWNFGDGSAVATTAVANHTYSTPGRFTAVVTVRDGRGASATASVTIDVGNRPPTPTITSPSASARFSVGQTITLSGSAADPEDGAVPDARLSWTVILHHNIHTHPFVPPTSGNGITFQTPPPEDVDATTTSYLEIRLTATDSQGAQSTVVRNFQPALVSVTFNSTPSGLAVIVNSKSIVTPATITSWDQYRLIVAAATQRDSAGESWLFNSWSDAGAASHTIVTPSAAASFAATFDHARRAVSGGDTYVRGGTYASQNFGTDGQLVVKQSADANYQRHTFMKFTVGSGTVGKAVLRLNGALSSSDTVPVAVRRVAVTSWSETAMTWNTMPSFASSVLSSASLTSAVAAWREWDVTSYVRSEIAAGHTDVAFALTGTANTSAYAWFNSRDASSNQPELLIGDGSSPPPPSGEVILYGIDASRTSGAWSLVADATAAGGSRMSNPDKGAAKLATPLAAPIDFFEVSFTARAGVAYRLWIRGKADRNSYDNDSVYVQFSNSTTQSGAAAYRIGSTAAVPVVIEDCSGCNVSGWGWQDNGYGTGVLGPLIYFDVSGPQTLRIQPREDGLSIDQIVLSPSRWLTTSPGATKNDTTILPR